MSKKEYCYISPEGNILKEEDGLSAKAEKEADELFSEIQNILKENDDNDKDSEDVKDMIIDAFKKGPLKWKFETNKCNKTSCSIKSKSISTNSTTKVKGDLTTHCEDVKQREGELKAIAAGKADLSFAGKQLAAGSYAAKVEGYGKVSYTYLQEQCSKEQTNRKQVVLSASGDIKATGCASAEIGVSKYKVKVKAETEAEAKGNANFLGLEERRFKKANESGVQVKVLDAQIQGDVSIKSKASVDLQYGDKNKKVQGEFEGHASGSASLKVLDATVSRSNDEIKAKAEVFHAEAKAEADFKAKITAGKSNLEADGKAKAEANFKLVNGKMLLKVKKKDGGFRIPGVKVELAKGKAECSAELNVKTGSDKPKKSFSASGKVQLKGAKINALKLDVRKKRDYGKKVYGKAEATGFEANTATAAITGKKEGFDTGVRAELTGMKLNAGNAQLTGIDDRTKLTSTLNVNTSVDVGNINVQGLGHKGSSCGANASVGVECFNVAIGLKRSTGVNVSTKLSLCNLNLTVGPPSLNFGFGHNFGIPFLGGGGGGGDGGKDGGNNGGKNGSDSGNKGGVFSDNNDGRCGDTNGVSSEEGFQSSSFSENYYSDGYDDNDSDDDLVWDENESSNAKRVNDAKNFDISEQKTNKANYYDKHNGSAGRDNFVDSDINESLHFTDHKNSSFIKFGKEGKATKSKQNCKERTENKYMEDTCRVNSNIDDEMESVDYMKHSFENNGVVSSPTAYMTAKHNDIGRSSTNELVNNMKKETFRDLHGHVIYNYSIDSDGHIVQSEDDCLIVIDDPSPEAVEGIADFFEATEIPNNSSADTTTAKQEKSSTFSNKINECGSQPRRSLSLAERDEIQFYKPGKSNIRYKPDRNTLSDCNDYSTENNVSGQGTYGYQHSTTATSAKSYFSKRDSRPKVVQQTDMCDTSIHKTGNIPKVMEPIQKSDIRRNLSSKKTMEENSNTKHSDVTVLEKDDMQTYSSDINDTRDVKASANQTRKLNLRDASDYNKHLYEVMAKKMKSERSPVEDSDSSKHNKQTYDLTEQNYDWTDTKRVKEDLIKASRSSKFTERDSKKRRSKSVKKATTEHKKFTTTDKGSGEIGNQQRKQKKKMTPQKPFGEKKNIHTIFTIGGGDTRQIKYIKDNVACFAEDG